MQRKAGWLALLAVGICWSSPEVAWSQGGTGLFELRVGTSGERALATLSPSVLQVENRGRVTRYERDRRLDVAGYTGYYNAAEQQAIRWPDSHTGSFQIGRRRGLGFDFTPSQMTIRRLALRPPAGGPGGPAGGGSTLAPAEVKFFNPHRQQLEVRIIRLPRTEQARFTLPAAGVRSVRLERDGGVPAQALYEVEIWSLGATGQQLASFEVPAGAALREGQTLAVPASTGTAGGTVPGPGLIDSGHYYELTSAGGEPRGLFLESRQGLAVMARRSGGKWILVPLTDRSGRPTGEYSLRLGDAPELGLTAIDGRAEPVLRRAGDDQTQAWRLVPLATRAGYVQIENVVRPGECLDSAPNGDVFLARPRGQDGQAWRLLKRDVVGPQVLPGLIPVPIAPLPVRPGRPRRRLLASETVPNPPLPPAAVTLKNDHRRELWVLVTDLRDPTASHKLRIPAGGGKTLALDRDAGSKIINRYEVYYPNGLIKEETEILEVAPRPWYDVSVYELAVQSVFIDRTLPRSQQTEKKGYSPKSVGWFELPAGAGLVGGELEVYKTAAARQNTGQVRRIEPREWEAIRPTADPSPAGPSARRQF